MRPFIVALALLLLSIPVLGHYYPWDWKPGFYVADWRSTGSHDWWLGLYDEAGEIDRPLMYDQRVYQFDPDNKITIPSDAVGVLLVASEALSHPIDYGNGFKTRILPHHLIDVHVTPQPTLNGHGEWAFFRHYLGYAPTDPELAGTSIYTESLIYDPSIGWWYSGTLGATGLHLPEDSP